MGDARIGLGILALRIDLLTAERAQVIEACVGESRGCIFCNWVWCGFVSGALKMRKGEDEDVGSEIAGFV